MLIDDVVHYSNFYSVHFMVAKRTFCDNVLADYGIFIVAYETENLDFENV